MKQKWIGLFEVRSKPGFDGLDGAAGGFVNIVGLADSESEFVKLAKDALEEFHIEVAEVSDVDLVEDRLENDDLVPDLIDLSDIITEEFPIQFDTFQTYRRDTEHDA